jgi:hypothetical protein
MYSAVGVLICDLEYKYIKELSVYFAVLIYREENTCAVRNRKMITLLRTDTLYQVLRH